MMEGLGVVPALPAARFARPPLPELPRGANQAVCSVLALCVFSAFVAWAGSWTAGRAGKAARKLAFWVGCVNPLDRGSLLSHRVGLRTLLVLINKHLLFYLSVMRRAETMRMGMLPV